MLKSSLFILALLVVAPQVNASGTTWSQTETKVKIQDLKSERIFWTSLHKSLVFVRDNRYSGLIIGLPAEFFSLAQYGSARAALWEVRKGEKGLAYLGRRAIGEGNMNEADKIVAGAAKIAEAPVNGALKLSIFNAQLSLAVGTPVSGLSLWYFLDATDFNRWIDNSEQEIAALNAHIAGLQVMQSNK